MEGKQIADESRARVFVADKATEMRQEINVETINPWLVAERIAMMLFAERDKRDK